MDVRRFSAALAGSCALLAPAPALAQSSQNISPVRIVHGAAPASEARLPPLPVREEEELLPGGMIGSWAFDDGVEVGIGRFRVTDPKRRTNMENERLTVSPDRNMRAIAGAGVRIRF